MGLKGISPLVAVIMLIAFTLVVAGILAGWAVQFSQDQTRNIQSCTDARVIIYSASFDQTSNSISLVVYNNGKIPLNFNTLVSYTNGSVEIVSDTLDITVEAGSVETFTIADSTGNSFGTLSEITVQADQCNGAQDFIQSRDIRDL